MTETAGVPARRTPAPHQEESKMAKDPVCGMQVDEKKAAATSVHQGTTYYFCAPACKATFQKNPQKFVTKPAGHGCH